MTSHVVDEAPYAEWFWANYLMALADQGIVTASTPPAEIWQMKTEFMAGLRGVPIPADPNHRENE